LPGDSVSVAVVGSRACSSLGLRRAARLGRALATAGVCVVSGLARGVDGAAHSACLAGGGRTLAVLGTGLSHCFPACHVSLASRVATSGALVSSFSPAFRGSRSSFPLRNGLIAALSQVLVVIEAAEHSGTRSAIRSALSLGRPVGLLQSLVASAPWAARLAEEPGVFVVSSVEDVISRLHWAPSTITQGVA
jgi:DNA processing protein